MEIMMSVRIALILIISFFLGSIPFGYLVSKYLKKIDIREYGSGNIGTANTFRVLGVRYALLVLIGDCSKGLLAVYLAKIVATESITLQLLTGLFAIMGHNWSIFLKLKGGKGIATTFGVILSIYPNIAFISAIIWVVLVIAFRFAALGSIVSVLSMFILSFIFETPAEFKYFLTIINLLAIFRHRSNIIRLLQHRENRIISNKDNFKKQDA
ncbi:MAG: glycerol-3-phosphate 1-O-acyltransferase PlsY [Atribacterota bacterium]|jgi:glycerol-3-phosphate acyltransferase PlsY|nr:glycerol-3-phosphate 1-O-acyltransferase PlsY [Atribacterota bacterium]